MNKSITVAAAIICDDRRIFATQRGYGKWEDWWEFPGGKVEPGETPEEAVAREIREELATTIHVDRPFMTVEYDYPNGHITLHTFLCTVEDGKLELLEHHQARWLDYNTLDDVDWLPADAAIIDALRHELLQNGTILQ